MHLYIKIYLQTCDVYLSFCLVIASITSIFIIHLLSGVFTNIFLQYTCFSVIAFHVQSFCNFGKDAGDNQNNGETRMCPNK